LPKNFGGMEMPPMFGIVFVIFISRFNIS